MTRLLINVLTSMLLAVLMGVYLLSLGCGFNQKPEAKRCSKVWDKATSRIEYQCVPLSQSTMDGER
jgi:hypothetical protein